MITDKKQINIYEIDKNNSLFSIDIENDKYLSVLLDMINKKAKEKKYSFKELPIKENYFQLYNVKYLLLSKESFPSWKTYLDESLKENLDIKQISKDTIIIFFENKESRNIYVTTFGSNGYFFIKDVIVDNFGLDILSRIVNPETMKIKYIKQQNLTGTKQGEINLYREFQTIETILDDFGRVLQESMVNINIENLEIFGFKQKETRRKNSKKQTKNCLTKDSFRINSAIEINQIENILNGCEIAKQRKKYPINNVEILHPKHDKELIDKLGIKLFDSLFKSYEKREGSFSYDISHKNFNEYFEAVKYEVKYINSKTIVFTEPIINIQKLFEELKSLKEGNVNIDILKDFVIKGRITTYDSENNILTDDSIFKHIFAEVTLDDGKKYFLLNGCWYHLIDDFIESLNDKIKNLFNNYKFSDNNFIECWSNSSDENTFINKHKEKSNTIIIHPNKINNIESCDMIHYDDDNLYLYFIKQGFRNEIRTLCSQIFISAKLIKKDLNTEKKYLKQLYAQIKNKCLSEIDEVSFLNLFNKKLIFVFVFYDSKNTTEERLLEENPEKFGSNIAKYSLLNLVKEIKTIDGVNLQICQIKK